MFVSRFDPDRNDPYALRRNREAFVEFLAKRIDRSLHRSVAIVFDAEKKIAKLPDRYSLHNIKIYFAQDHVSADDLIEELIKKDTVPKKLLVVSSDHRLQRAAKRRGAKWQDSDEWFDQLVEQKHDSSELAQSSSEKPSLSIKIDVSKFESFEERIAEEIENEVSGSGRKRDDQFEKDGQPLESENPFPDGYADDLG